MSNYNANSLISNLDNKRYSDLNWNLKMFIKNMYPKIKSNDIIYCFKTYNKKIVVPAGTLRGIPLILIFTKLILGTLPSYSLTIALNLQVSTQAPHLTHLEESIS